VPTSAADTSSSTGAGGGGGGVNQTNITLLGDSFNQKAIRGLVDQLSAASGDGARIRVTGV